MYLELWHAQTGGAVLFGALSPNLAAQISDTPAALLTATGLYFPLLAHDDEWAVFVGPANAASGATARQTAIMTGCDLLPKREGV